MYDNLLPRPLFYMILQILNFLITAGLMFIKGERLRVVLIWAAFHTLYVSGTQNIFQFSVFLLILIALKTAQRPPLETAVILSALAEVFFYRTDHVREISKVHLANAIGNWNDNFFFIQALNLIFNSIGARYILPFLLILLLKKRKLTIKLFVLTSLIYTLNIFIMGN